MKNVSFIFAPLVFLLTLGCASSIVDSQGIRLAKEILPPKSANSNIEIIFNGRSSKKKYETVGKVVSRAWVLEKGIEAVKAEARKLGADAVVNLKYERKMSIDYGQDLFSIDGDAVVWK